MTIEIVLEGKLTEEKDFEGYLELIQDICKERKLKMEFYDRLSFIDVCPEGYIQVSYENQYLSISSQTNVVGAGFHAYVCEFLDVLIEKSPLELQVSDPTDYFAHRDFERLKYKIYYQWLSDLSAYILDQKDQVKDLCISWQVDYYLPKEKKGYVITPMGYIPVTLFEPQHLEELAQTFFIWNNKEKNALFYKNCALNLLWKECYFEYSNMDEKTVDTTHMILDYLEMAFEKDASIPLPILEYYELCETMNREIKITNPISMISIPQIGYRRDIIQYQLGAWSIPVDGCAEKRVTSDKTALVFMAPFCQNDQTWHWMYKISTMTFEESIDHFLPLITNDEQHEIFECEGIKGAISITKEDEYQLIHAQYICKNETLFLHLYVRLNETIDPLMDLIKHVRYRSLNSDLKAN